MVIHNMTIIPEFVDSVLETIQTTNIYHAFRKIVPLTSDPLSKRKLAQIMPTP